MLYICLYHMKTQAVCPRIRSEHFMLGFLHKNLQHERKVSWSSSNVLTSEMSQAAMCLYTSHFQQWHLINSTSKWWCLNEMGEWWYGKLISPSGIALDTINISPNGWLNNYIMLIAYTILYCTNLHLIITINCLW